MDNLTEKLRDLSECPPDCPLEYWIKVLVSSHNQAIKREEKLLGELINMMGQAVKYS